MRKQLIFKEKYTQLLKANTVSKESLEFYRSSNFVYDKNEVLIMSNIEVSPDLLDKLDVNDDCRTAITIYEAYKNLAPIQASDERLWVYLAHVDFYPYMVKRWPGVHNGKAANPRKYILDHWFLASSAQSSLIRHAIAGFWWSVYLSVDESRGENKYDLTKILFRQLDFPKYM